MSQLPWLDDDDLWFPSTELALVEPSGLLAAGGDLSPARLHLAYQHGIFPWFEDDQPILWWAPTPRAVIEPSKFIPKRSLAKTLRKRQYEIRIDTQFETVIEACAAPRDEHGGTWITEEMQQAYLEMHRLGYAHSIEVYMEGALAGGLYGLGIGSMFFGESMFSRANDASKIAFAFLCTILTKHNCPLIDCQMENSHLMSLGCELIDRNQFELYLSHNRRLETEIDWLKIRDTDHTWPSSI